MCGRIVIEWYWGPVAWLAHSLGKGNWLSTVKCPSHCVDYAMSTFSTSKHLRVTLSVCSGCFRIVALLSYLLGVKGTWFIVSGFGKFCRTLLIILQRCFVILISICVKTSFFCSVSIFDVVASLISIYDFRLLNNDRYMTFSQVTGVKY